MPAVVVIRSVSELETGAVVDAGSVLSLTSVVEALSETVDVVVSGVSSVVSSI